MSGNVMPFVGLQIASEKLLEMAKQRSSVSTYLSEFKYAENCQTRN